MPVIPQIDSSGASAAASHSLPVTVYTPESPLSHPQKLLADMWKDLLASRELAWRLFVRDTSAMYRQSFLGYVWAFLPPIATTLTFTFLSSQKIFSVGDDLHIPVPAFVMIGTLLWQTFLDSLNSPLRAVANSRAMLAKINFPREALILGGLADVIFNLLIRMVLLVPVYIHYDLPLGGAMLLAPLAVLALVILGAAIGMMLTPLGILYSDIGRGVGIIAGFWMLLTPVVYQLPKHGLAAWLAQWNPVSPILQTARDWLTLQPATHLEGFLVVTAVALVVLFFSWILYRLTMPILIERMGG